MNVLLAIPLLLVPQAPPPAGEAPGGMISFEVRLVECEAAGWRESCQARLRFGGHRAGFSAWVADRETLDELGERLASSPDAKVERAPTVVATAGDPAIIGTCTTRHFVVHAEPADADAAAGAEGEGEAEGEGQGPRPIVAPVEDGAQIRLAGLPRPEGTLLKVEVKETRVADVHVVEVEAPGGEGGTTVRVQVPEVFHREMGGEWLVPTGHGLVLSLGVQSAPGDGEGGEPSVRERLLLIAAAPSVGAPDTPAADPGLRRVKAVPAPAVPVAQAPAEVAVPATAPAPAAPGLVMQPGQVPVALAATPWGLLPILPVEFVAAGPVEARVPIAAAAPAPPMPLPRLPSRTLPPAVGADGRPVDPRTEKDRQAERTEFTPYVDGQPVPSPQVTVPVPGGSAEEPADDAGPGDGQVVSASPGAGAAAVAKKDESTVTVRLWFTLARGLGVDVSVDPKAGDGSEPKLGAGEAPVRR